jgi:hypothetical protein
MEFSCTTHVTINANSVIEAYDYQDGIIKELQSQGYVVDSVLTPIDLHSKPIFCDYEGEEK